MDDDGRMSETSSGRNRGQRQAVTGLDELEGTGSGSIPPSHIRPQLRCNACWEPILPDVQSAETCYRTGCGHLFCEKCAYKHFGQGRLQCPSCRADAAGSPKPDEQKAYQIQHGEKYIQLKNYTDQLEAELRETKAKMQTLTASNDELREVG
ncbi:hypothetical protein PHYBOEH_001673 [Phytophthora boehmeriae]|uniref:RING-type domain-containing protein n=1 Tax=Phytophthora boehmeriae TaxID=109152 RepID=A0A8T1WYH8_9STRA|nr:hypothetical protein PHYBOEH_001673 [Phytophthora boehmeriae]